MTERFSIVNGQDHHIRIVDNTEDLHSDNMFHRAVHVIVETHGGGMMIQKKAKHTENGGKWSSSASGHVRYQETYKQAAIRELEEETGLKVTDEEELIEVIKASPCEETGYEFVMLYSYLIDPHEEEPKIGCDEVDEIVIAPLAVIVKDICDNNDKYSPAFVEMLNRFLSMHKSK